MSGSSRPTMAFIEFKKQLASLSESLRRFDAVERSKALEILQECIQSFQNQHSFPLDEAIPEEVMNTVDAMTEDNQNNVVYCTLDEDMCLQKNLPVVEQNECAECTVPEEVINSVDAMTVERQNVVYCTINGNLCLGKNLCIIERQSENCTDCVVPEEVMNTVDAMNEDKQNDDGVLCALNEDLGLEENIPEVGTDDDSSECAVPEEVMKTVDAMTEDKENDDVFCNLNEDLGLEKNLTPVETDDCSNCHLYEEMTNLMTETRQVKNIQYLSTEHNCQEVNTMTLNEQIENEVPAYSPVPSPNLMADTRRIENSKYLSHKNRSKVDNMSEITLDERIQEEVLQYTPVSSPDLLADTRQVEGCEYLSEDNNQEGSTITIEDSIDEEVLEYRRVSSPNVISETGQVVANCEYLSPEESSEEVSTIVEERTEEEVSEYNQSPPVRSPSPITSEDDCESHCNAEWRSLLKCPECDQDCESKSSLLEHLQHHSGKVKVCKHCRKIFNNLMAFKFHKHLEMCSKSNKMLKCKLCNKTLLGCSQYNTHISAHKRNQCKICGDHFARKKHLDTHTANVHNSSAGKSLFRCHVCERAFVQRRSLVYHFNQAHNEGSGDHICPVCLDMFDSAELLEAHTASSHRPQVFTCDKCDNTFSRRQQYLVHMKTHERYKCETCSMGFSAKKAAVKHARQGHQVSGIETQLQCSLCGQLFCSRTLLKTHMILHTGEGSLTCEKCKITFKHERNYKSHLETEEHLRGEEKNLLACKECNKTFTNKQNLRIHSIRMHKEGSKEHSCIHCSYKTVVLNNLKRHIALHTERPQFICDKCGAQLQTKNALQAHHLSMHSSTKEFSCDKCGKMFGRSSDLRRHLQNTHSETAIYSCHCNNSYKTLSSLKRHQKLSHGKVELKQQRLKKLFLPEDTDPPKKKVKTSKKKAEQSSTDVNDLQIMNSQMPLSIDSAADAYEQISSPAVGESEAVVTVTETDPQELLEVTYDMDFDAEDKAHVVYAQNLDMNALHVVESMIELDGDPAKQGASVLINVRNLFGRTLANDFIMPSHFVSSVDVEDSLAEASQHTAVASQKPDVIPSLQDYDIPHDLSFLNV